MKLFITKILRNDVVRNSSWLVADKIIRLFGGLLVGALVARYLGPEQYGLMNFVSAFAAIFISFSMLGIDNLVIRELSRKNAEINKILGTAVKIRNCGSVISSILSLIFAYFLYYDNNSLFLLLLAIFMVGNILQSLDVISLWYQSRIESKYVIRNKLIAYITVSVLKVIAVAYGADIICFVVMTVVDSLLGLAFLVRWAKIKNGLDYFSLAFDKMIARKFLHEGIYLAMSNFSISIFMRMDQILLGSLVGNKEVGIYAVASLISDILYSIPIFICASSFPKIASYWDENRERYYSYNRKIFLGMVLYAYFSCFCVYLLVDWFVVTLYGTAYIESGMVAKIHSLTLLFVAIGCVRGNMLLVQHHSRILSLITISGGLCNIALNYIFIPLYGVYGAAVSVLVTQSIVCYGSGIFTKDLRKIMKMQTSAILLMPLGAVVKKLVGRSNQ